MPVLSLPHVTMFVRSFNGQNDSLANRKQPEFAYSDLDDVLRTYFKQNFNIDEAAVKAAWAAL